MSDHKDQVTEVELIKIESPGLKGSILDTVNDPAADHFNDADKQLLKFHGVYQQDNREIRQKVRGQGSVKTYMMMVRAGINGGCMTADQYLALDALADKCGNGTLRVTSRQGIQYHHVVKGDMKPLIKEINLALLTTIAACGDVQRNLMMSNIPLVSKRHERLKAIADELGPFLKPKNTSYFDIWLDGEKIESPYIEKKPGDPDLYGPEMLPRKFKSCVMLPDDNSVDVLSQCMGFIAIEENGEIVGFNLTVGGGHGMTHGKEETFPRLADVVGFLPVEKIKDSAAAVVRFYAENGDRTDRKHARLKYVVHEWGVAKVRKDLEKRQGFQFEPARPFALGRVEPLGWQERGDGLGWYGIWVENGRIQDENGQNVRSAIREAVETFKPEVRLTADQDVLLNGLTESQGREVEAILKKHGAPLPGSLSQVRRHELACPALPTCGLALAEAERVSPDVIDALELTLDELDLDDQPIFVRMTGCPNGCVRPYSAEIGIVGRMPGKYNLYVGGTAEGDALAEFYAERVPQKRIAHTLYPLLKAYAEQRRTNEPFGKFCQRIDLAPFRAMAQEQAAAAD